MQTRPVSSEAITSPSKKASPTSQRRRLKKKSYPSRDNFRLSPGQKDFAAPQGPTTVVISRIGPAVKRGRMVNRLSGEASSQLYGSATMSTNSRRARRTSLRLPAEPRSANGPKPPGLAARSRVDAREWPEGGFLGCGTGQKWVSSRWPMTWRAHPATGAIAKAKLAPLPARLQHGAVEPARQRW
jgi:hypothetical protein